MVGPWSQAGIEPEPGRFWLQGCVCADMSDWNGPTRLVDSGSAVGLLGCGAPCR
jgi:hypothetical protein